MASYLHEIDLDNKFIIFQDKLLKTKKANIHYFNFLNLLCKKEDKDFYNKFLLKDLGQSQKVKSFQVKEYITVHVRYTTPESNLYSLESLRNTSEKEFIQLISSLKKNIQMKKY